MNNPKYPHSSWVVSVVMLLTLLSISSVKGQNSETTNTQLPRGQWTFSAEPYTGPGYENLQVRVSGVTSEIEGLSITKVGVENRSSQSLTAIKLAWYLSTQQNPDVVLKKGQTRWLELPGEIWAGEVREVIYPVTSFAKIYKPLLRGSILSGNYRLQVAVSEARFKDGMTWTLAASRHNLRATQVINAAYHISRAPQFCANQRCESITPAGDPGGAPIGYRCTDGNGQSCANTGTSCTNSICGAGGGGGPRPPVTPPRTN